MRHDKPRTFDGITILDIAELVRWLDQGFWVRIGGLPFHPAWIMQHKLHEVLYRLAEGLICRALDEHGAPYMSAVSNVHKLTIPTEEQRRQQSRKVLSEWCRMSVVIRNNRLQIVGSDGPVGQLNFKVVASPVPTPASLPAPTPLPRSIPARKVAILGDLSGTGEMFHCESLTETITSPTTGIIYHYCGVSDGIAYYRTKEQMDEVAELQAVELENERTK